MLVKYDTENPLVFINNPGEVEVEVGSEKVSRVGASIAGNSLEYFIIYGEHPLNVRSSSSQHSCLTASIPDPREIYQNDRTPRSPPTVDFWAVALDFLFDFVLELHSFRLLARNGRS